MRYEVLPPEGVSTIDLPSDLRVLPMPQYRTPRGETRPITGPAADAWPFPREIYGTDGSVFIEMPMPYYDGWGITFHAPRPWPRTPFGAFCQQYAEGRASGFPFWATFVFSLREAGWTMVPKRLRRTEV